MKRSVRSWIWAALALFLLILAAYSEYQSSEVSLISKQVTLLEQGSDVPRTVTTLSQAPASRLWQIIASALWAIGSSILISVYIISRMEERRKEDSEASLDRIRNAINQDVFSSLFKRLVPKELFEIIRSELIRCKIVRRDAQWFFDFKELGDGQEIELRQTIKCRLHNIGHEPVEDGVQVKWDKDHSDGNGLIRVVCKNSDGSSIDFDRSRFIGATDDRVQVIPGETETTIHVALVIPANGYADVTMVVKQIYPKDQVSDCFFTRYPIIDASLMATFPATYEFGLFQSLTSELVCTLVDSGRSIYEAKGAIFPGQGFAYSLKKKTVIADAESRSMEDESGFDSNESRS